ncbi:MAG TPA: DUF6702 family protein [Gemmatimonadales bacterium]
MVGLRFLLAPLLIAAVHPLHTTFTELAEQPGGKRVTIVVRAFSDDLNAAVHAGTSSPVSDDSLISRYVRSRLGLTTTTGAPVSLNWVGRRVTGDLTWITLEADVPGGLAGAHLRNAIHNELFPDQVNIVQARFAGRSVSLLFTGGDGEKTVQ